MDIQKSADNILDLFQKYGAHDYIGESITQIEHMVQCAMIAETEGHDNNFILAALLHDIGHLLAFETDKFQAMALLGTLNHETIGQNYLQSLGFSDDITKLVGNHVKAKRYLVSTKTKYYENLSEASKKTLNYQGNLMNQTEIEEFKKDKYFKLSLKLRKIDDRGKEQNVNIKSIDHYIPLILNHLQNNKN